MSDDRKQSPHYIRELDPNVNGSDEGNSDIARGSAFELLLFGVILAAITIFFESKWGIAISVLIVGLGIALFCRTGLGQYSRNERN